MRIYISGPMTGIEEFNYPLFNSTATRLREQGYEVINPAETDDGDTSKPWDYYMRIDIAHVLSVDALVVLPGWQASKGASLEVTIARALGVPVWDSETLEPWSESILSEASRLTSRDRQQAYGAPLDDFSRTAEFWNVRFGHMMKHDEPGFVAEDVAAAMRLVKESRLTNTPGHRDSLTDIAGYARTQEMCWDERERRAANPPIEGGEGIGQRRYCRYDLC